MLETINSFTEELERRLTHRVAPERLAIILRETSSHLEESAHELVVTQGLDPENAAIAAIVAFGYAKGIAGSFLKENGGRFWGIPAARVASASGLIATGCLICSLTMFNGYFDNFGDSWKCVPAGIIGFASLVTLFLACRARRRSCRGVLTLTSFASAGCLIPLISFWIIGDITLVGQGVSRFHVERDIEYMGQDLKTLDLDRKFLVETAPLVAAAKTIDQLPIQV